MQTTIDPNDPQVQAQLRLSARVELAKRCAKEGDVLGWGKAIFQKKFSLPFCHELHDYLVETMLEEFTNTEAPRNHAKTTIRCFLIPIYLALERPDLFKHYLNVQATGKKAIAVNLAIRNEIEKNLAVRTMYGDLTSSEKWLDSQFVLANGIVFTAISAGQSIRGLNYNNIRPDFINVDDLYDDSVWRRIMASYVRYMTGRHEVEIAAYFFESVVKKLYREKGLPARFGKGLSIKRTGAIKGSVTLTYLTRNFASIDDLFTRALQDTQFNIPFENASPSFKSMNLVPICTISIFTPNFSANSFPF